MYTACAENSPESTPEAEGGPEAESPAGLQATTMTCLHHLVCGGSSYMLTTAVC